MVPRAAVYTSLLPKTFILIQYSTDSTTGIYHYALWWARQIIKIKTFRCPRVISVIHSKRPSNR